MVWHQDFNSHGKLVLMTCICIHAQAWTFADSLPAWPNVQLALASKILRAPCDDGVQSVLYISLAEPSKYLREIAYIRLADIHKVCGTVCQQYLFKPDCTGSGFCECQTTVSLRTQAPHVDKAKPDLAKADALW